MKKLLSVLITGLFIMASMLMALPANASDNTFVNGINSARANQGKAQLVVNGDLQRTAQDKANRMARANSLTADGYSDSWKGGSQAVAADPAARASELLRNDFLGKQGETTLNSSYGIIGVGEAVSSNGTLFVAINVAPKPYVPSTGGSEAGSGDSGSGNTGSVDNSAAIAAAEARVRAEVAEAKRVADAQAKALAEEEAKKQSEAKKVADAEAVKKAEADKKAEELRLAQEAENKRIEQEAIDTKTTEAEVRIAEAEEKARIEGEAKKKAEADVLKKNEAERERFEMLLTSLRILTIISILTVICSAVVVFRSKPVTPQSFEAITGMENPVVDETHKYDNEEDEYLSDRIASLEEKAWMAPMPTTGSLPNILPKK